MESNIKNVSPDKVNKEKFISSVNKVNASTSVATTSRSKHGLSNTSFAEIRTINNEAVSYMHSVINNMPDALYIIEDAVERMNDRNIIKKIIKIGSFDKEDVERNFSKLKNLNDEGNKEIINNINLIKDNLYTIKKVNKYDSSVGSLLAKEIKIIESVKNDNDKVSNIYNKEIPRIEKQINSLNNIATPADAESLQQFVKYVNANLTASVNIIRTCANGIMSIYSILLKHKQTVHGYYKAVYVSIEGRSSSSALAVN